MTTDSLQRHLILDIQGQNTPAKLGVKRDVMRELILRNRSDRTLAIDLWVEPNDARSAPVRQWCQFDQTTPTILPHQETQVILRFEIPPQTPAGFYSYTVCAQAPDFPEETERRSQQLEILPSEQDIALRNEPTFRLHPPTTSADPYKLQPGKPFPIQVMVNNHSKRVDRFFLTCPELSVDWFSVTYPEANPNQPGQITHTDGLQLNPEAVGPITLKLHPPALTIAGQYSTTLRLTSTNQNHLVLLDILYFTIQVNSQISASLTPKMGHIPGNDAEFVVLLQNQGNIQRHLTVTAADGDRLFDYDIYPNPVQLIPGGSESVQIRPHTKKWWRRQWKKRQDVRFQVKVHDTPTDADDWETPADSVLALPQPRDGKILWEAYPTWLRWLLKGLLFALLLTLAAVLARFALKWFVVDPRLEPRVLTLTTPKESYTVRGQNPIPLDFELSNAQSSQNGQTNIIQFIFADRDAKVLFTTPAQPPSSSAGPEILEAQAGITWEWLKAQTTSCQEEQRPSGPLLNLAHRLVYRRKYTPLILSCQGLTLPNTLLQAPGNQASGDQASVVFRPGVYEVEIKLHSHKAKPLSAKAGSDPVSANPVSANPVSANPVSANLLKWLPWPQKRPRSTASNPASSAAIVAHTKQLKNIQLTPPEPPQISYFYSKANTYRDQAAVAFPQVGDSLSNLTAADLTAADLTAADLNAADLNAVANSAPPVDPTLSLSSAARPTPAPANAQFPAAPIKLSWVVDRPWTMTELVLSHILITADGNIVNGDPVSYAITPTSLGALDPWCEWTSRKVAPNVAASSVTGSNVTGSNVTGSNITGSNVSLLETQEREPTGLEKLICKDVPTSAELPGEYTFTLDVITAGNTRGTDEAIAAETEPITIRAPYPQILSFTVNGQEAIDHPQHVHFINPARGAVDVMVAWDIANPDQATVELLPAPGGVTTTMSPMPFSLPPGNNTLTLQVSNAAGEVTQQSVVISVNEAPKPTLRPTVPLPLTPVPLAPPPPSTQVPDSSNSIPIPPAPTELQPGQLSDPLQVPPSGN